MEAILIAGLWILLSFTIALTVAQKGANPALWFLCSLVLTPALGWTMARWLEESPPVGVLALTKCPYCGAVIPANADACLRCHADFPQGIPRKLVA